MIEKCYYPVETVPITGHHICIRDYLHLCVCLCHVSVSVFVLLVCMPLHMQ